jgi:hypothetical protein
LPKWETLRPHIGLNTFPKVAYPLHVQLFPLVYKVGLFLSPSLIITIYFAWWGMECTIFKATVSVQYIPCEEPMVYNTCKSFEIKFVSCNQEFCTRLIVQSSRRFCTTKNCCTRGVHCHGIMATLCVYQMKSNFKWST